MSYTIPQTASNQFHSRYLFQLKMKFNFGKFNPGVSC